MKVVLTIIFIVASLSSYADEKSQVILEEALGRVLTKHDEAWRYTDGLDPYQYFDIVALVKNEYKVSIATLPVEYRSYYYWSIYDHAHLGSHEAEDIIFEMYDCCPENILELIENYIEMHTRLHGTDGRIKKWKGVQHHLNTLKNINHEKP